METIAYIIISTLLAGVMLVVRDLPVISGSVLASGAGERTCVRILTPVILGAALVVPCFLPTIQWPVGSSLPAPDDILPIGIATVAASVIVGRFSRYPAVPFAFMAAIGGVGLASGNGLSWQTGVTYALSWLAAPVICACLAAAVYMLFALGQRGKKTHLAVQEARMMPLAAFVGLALIAAFAINNSLIFTWIPLHEGAGTAAATAPACALVLWLCTRRHVTQAKWNLADNELDTNTQSILSLLLAMAATFILFSSPMPAMIGLTASPLPAGSLYMAALLGISVARQRALADGQDILLAVIAAIVSPALALMFAYCLGRIMDGGGAGNLIVLCLALLAAVMIIYTRWQNRRTMHRQIVANREQQVYSTQKSLSALEVKAEMTEKDLLNKLDIKRKELVDFAVGVSDQKEFMEKVYEDLKAMRTLDDEDAKNAATDALLSTLRERMYFTREMNDFYAQSEVLNKDFNMRLSELFPNLTEGERKLTNLLRQGFSSKYIASLMNITPKSVEINRSRLRAKLGLTRSDNLIQFIKSI